MKRRLGKIGVSQDVLLDWLCFEGGEIVDVRMDFDFRNVVFLVKHDDMPEVENGGEAKFINPSYQYLSKNYYRLPFIDENQSQNSS